jgi:hypothetical protein
VDLLGIGIVLGPLGRSMSRSMSRSMIRSRSLPLLAALVMVLLPKIGAAAPLTPEAVPEPLRPWIGWVLHDVEQVACPYVQGSTEERRCMWPSLLKLTVGEQGGSFEQVWKVHERGWAPLPGEGKRWPQSVTIDGAPAVVSEQQGAPGVTLEPGVRAVKGEFLWDSLPEQLKVPAETGLLELVLNEKKVTAPQRDASGVLWLHRRAQEGAEANRLDLVVNRRISDSIPMVVTTKIEVQAAGKNREVVLGKALLTGFVPMSVSSDLPVRLEPDGRLRAQVRPGRWEITVEGHYDGAITALPLEASEGPWASDEIWVFEAHPELRRVEVSGVVTVDPQQTRLPDPWKSLPAYQVQPGAMMVLSESQRGEVDRGADRLKLSRQWWLDYDGKGVTIQDRLSGEIRQGSRLAMNGPARLGRVSDGANNLFITYIEGPEKPGVELRDRDLTIEAESRVPMSQELSAVDWDQDFHAVSGTFHLPPGWRLLHVSGVDDVGESWLSRWDLLEIFLVLVISIAVARMYGLLWGLLALITMALVFPEWMAPRTVWLFVLAGEGLLRVLPAGRLRGFARLYRLATLVTLAGVVVSFAVQQVRQGLYPALERRSEREDFGGLFFLGMARDSAPAWDQDKFAEPQAAAMDFEQEEYREDGSMGAPEEAPSDGRSYGSKSKSGLYAMKGPKDELQAQRVQQLREYDASTVVQTGPGVPSWRWRSVNLGWSGPVERGQRLRLYLLSPPVNLVLGLLRVLFVGVLTLVAFGVLGRRRPTAASAGAKAGAKAGAMTALLALLGFGAPLLAPNTAQAEVPSQSVLDELRGRLIEAPECLPECVTIPRLRLTVTPEMVRMVLEVHAGADVAMPLPGSAEQWSPTMVSIDDLGAEASRHGLARASGGGLWLEMPAGRHDVVLEGPLATRETVQLSFPLRPYRVEATASGWTIDGLHEDGVSDRDLQLTRVHSEEGGSDSLEIGPLPPFVRVERSLMLGLTWEVSTRVVRMTPPGAAVVLTVPLLPGESVTTAELRVDDGKAQVNMGPEVLEAGWSSVLEVTDVISLTAAERQPWVELWRLEVGPVWHVETSGIPVIRRGSGGLREWQPWPGESVALTIGRPRGIDGQTLTIDNAHVRLQPGMRATDATLEMQLRSSRGGHHDVLIPAGAVLQTVSINGREQPIGQDGQNVRLPVVPGVQSVSLSWREPVLLGERFTAPVVQLGGAAVNVSVTIDMPRDRWILWVNGPRMGPAVLFWSYIFMLVLVSLALGQIRWTPLRTHQWFLLGIGLSPLPVPAAMTVIGWLLFMGWRARTPALSPGWFNLRQLFAVGWAFVAMGALIGAITAGLLGQPDMQIEGNGSYGQHLCWFQDRTEGGVAQPWAVSVSIWWYRGAMLLWALWLAQALLRWLPWAWRSFSGGGYWKKIPIHWSYHVRPGDEERGHEVVAPVRGSSGSVAGAPTSGPAQPGEPWLAAPVSVGVRPESTAPAAAPAPAPAPAPAAAPAKGAAAATEAKAGFTPPHLRKRQGPPPPAPKGTVIPQRISTRAGEGEEEET